MSNLSQPVFFWLLLLFICVPFIELALLLFIHEHIGFGLTLALVVVTALVGSALARSQGFRTYRRINEELAAGRMPQSSLVDAVMIFVAGALLFTPGVLTDLFGLSLLLPPCRAVYRRWLASWFQARFKIDAFHMHHGYRQSHDPNVVDSHVVEPSPTSEEKPTREEQTRLKD